MDWPIYLPLVLTIVAGIVYAVRLEGSITQGAALFAAHEEQDDERHTDVKDWLKRIDAKLDTLPALIQALKDER